MPGRCQSLGGIFERDQPDIGNNSLIKGKVAHEAKEEKEENRECQNERYLFFPVQHWMLRLLTEALAKDKDGRKYRL